MNCELCGGAMWDNTQNKKNPKGPDFKCKDKACGHAVWLPKPKKVENRPVSAPNKAIPAPITEAKKEMLISYAKDIVVAEIAKGDVKEPFKRVADGFKVLMVAYSHPFGKVSANDHLKADTPEEFRFPEEE